MKHAHELFLSDVMSIVLQPYFLRSTVLLIHQNITVWFDFAC